MNWSQVEIKKKKALKKNALIFQDQIENTVKQVDTQVERVAIVEIQIKEMHTYTGNLFEQWL